MLALATALGLAGPSAWLSIAQARYGVKDSDIREMTYHNSRLNADRSLGCRTLVAHTDGAVFPTKRLSTTFPSGLQLLTTTAVCLCGAGQRAAALGAAARGLRLREGLGPRPA